MFFSIHVNAARSSAAAGTETFVMVWTRRTQPRHRDERERRHHL
ncbi:MAG: hypothetical protein ACLR8Y_17275 [Alistipes indistinctus]